MKVLFMTVELSDQTGREKTILVGVFSDDTEIEQAKEKAERKYKNHRVYFTYYSCALNEYMTK